ncbi:MAG: SDR family NAD(P)-dependent oxidoreductase [Alloprevotella sp.]
MNTPYALVTGASSGIGYEYAVAMARRRYQLIVVSNEDAIHDKAAELRRRFPDIDVRSLVIDLGVQDAAQRLYLWCEEQQLEVEVLINNAGVYHDRDFLADSPAFNALILNLHVFTPAMLTYYFGQAMQARRKGYVLNMSSVTSNYGIQRMSTYASTKAFLRYFSSSLHIELRRQGVSVTCVRPGAVATPLYSISPRAMRLGLAVGAIVRPEQLAETGVKALFSGKHEITPGFFTKILNIVPFIPIGVLRLIRRWGWF